MIVVPSKFLFRLFEDKIGNDIRSQTKVYKRWIKKDKVVYSVEKEIDVKTLQIKYKRPITFRETQFSRFIIVYDKQLGSIPFEAVEGNKIVFGVGLEGLVTIPLNTEINSLLIAGCSGSGKSSMTKSIITNLILNNIPTWVMDNKKSHDYDVFENHLPLYKGIEQFSEFLNKVSNELDSRLLKKHNKPLVIVIDEVFSIKLLKNGKILLDKLAVLLSTCRGGNVHFIIVSQRSTTSVLPSEITTHISIRVALQQSTKQESINVIYSDDAYYITSKGRGYLSINGRLNEFCAFYLTDTEIEERLPKVDKISPVEDVKIVKNYVIGGNTYGDDRKR